MVDWNAARQQRTTQKLLEVSHCYRGRKFSFARVLSPALHDDQGDTTEEN
jgi:hypothetical protein